MIAAQWYSEECEVVKRLNTLHTAQHVHICTTWPSAASEARSQVPPAPLAWEIWKPTVETVSARVGVGPLLLRGGLASPGRAAITVAQGL